MNLRQTIRKVLREGLHDTSWQNDEGDKITLMDLLNATEDIPVEKVSVEELKPHLLTWDGDEDEVKKIESADLQYPILIFVEDSGKFISIIDGHHRAQKAVRKGLKTIKAKIIPINSLPKNIRKVFGHMGKEKVMNVNESKEWGDSKQKLEKTFKFKEFKDSIDFVNKVAKIAEKQNHHPNITINYNKVKISITDHEKGGVSDKCHKFVKSVNKLEKPNEEEQNESEVTEYSRTLKNARKQGDGLRFPKSAIKSNPLRFRPYNRK